MPTFKLDGKPIPFEPGDTIIKAAWRQGIEIPHYCWHPGLTVAGQLPHVPRRDRAQARNAPDDARHPRVGREARRLPVRARSRSSSRPATCRPPRAWKCWATRASTSCEARRRRAGVSAPEPPGRLPHLRPVRRVQAPGLLARARAVRRSACATSRSTSRRASSSGRPSSTTPSAASCARAASGSWRRSRRTPCSTCASAAT